MSIKVKTVTKGTIKTLDKGKIGAEKTKDNIVNIKEKSENAYNNNEDNANAYAVNRLSSFSKSVPPNVKAVSRIGNKSIKDSKNNLIKTKNKVKNIKSKLAEKKKIKRASKNIKVVYSKIKKDKKVAKETVKTTKNARKLAKEATKRTYQSIKAAVKLSVKAVKAIIAGTKMLISAICAIGWVGILVIVIICLVGALCSSIYGIFFSNEDTGNSVRMSDVVREINFDMSNRIKDIQNSNTYDDYRIISDRAKWKDVLVIYVAKVSNGTMENEVLTIDDNKKETLKNVFWDMNTLTSEVKDEMVEETLENNETRIVQKKILYITISNKTIDEIMNLYNFNAEQRKQVEELMSEELDNLWLAPIYGANLGSPGIVEIALQEVGNVGGEKFWKWYGFDSRVEWCAIFVSWAANEAGYIDSNVIPKFAGVWNGVDWFKALGEWQDSSYIPKSGDIIFFDWEIDGKPNHVGIVEKVENNKVYTIEGNSKDECKNKTYDLNSNVIFGYGVPAY